MMRRMGALLWYSTKRIRALRGELTTFFALGRTKKHGFSGFYRSDKAWHVAFKKAGLTLIKQETQLGLPKGLYTVITYVLSTSFLVVILDTDLVNHPHDTRYALR